MPVTTNTRKLAALLGASGAGIGTDGLLQAAAVDANIATQAELDAIPIFDDNKIQTNLALLAFKAATNGSLAKYNLQDQVIDEFESNAGVDASASTNEILASGSYSGSATTTPSVSYNGQGTGTHGLYTWYKWTTEGSSGTLTTDTAQDYEYLVVGGGGGGGYASGGGGGGAGAFRTGTLAVAATTISSITVGSGANGSGAYGSRGQNGVDSVFSTITADGGGGGGSEESAVRTGAGGTGIGSGGGAGRDTAAGGAPANELYGNDGGASVSLAGGGGGGAGADGGAGTNNQGGAGGVGYNIVMGMNSTDSDAFLSAATVGVNHSGLRHLAGGGGGGTGSSGTKGLGGGGGGGNGGQQGNLIPEDATAGTGSGGGGALDANSSSQDRGGDGAAGVVLIRRLTSITTINDLTLQSTDTEAEAQPTKADMVMLVEDAGSGVGTVNTHVKGWISRDSGTTFTQGTLVDEGDWGTDKRILAFHDLDISGQPADQTM